MLNWCSKIISYNRRKKKHYTLLKRAEKKIVIFHLLHATISIQALLISKIYGKWSELPLATPLCGFVRMSNVVIVCAGEPIVFRMIRQISYMFEFCGLNGWKYFFWLIDCNVMAGLIACYAILHIFIKFLDRFSNIFCMEFNVNLFFLLSEGKFCDGLLSVNIFPHTHICTHTYTLIHTLCPTKID